MRIGVTVAAALAPLGAAVIYTLLMYPPRPLVPHPLTSDVQIELFQRQAVTERLLFMTALLSLVGAGLALLPRKWVPTGAVSIFVAMTALLVAVITGLSIWA